MGEGVANIPGFLVVPCFCLDLRGRAWHRLPENLLRPRECVA